MSSNRDKARDWQRTREVLAGGSRVDESNPSKNWLGHTEGATQIDDMLVNGATKAEMAKARGAVDQHLRHLRLEHGLPVVESGGRLVFDRRALEAGTPPDAAEDTPRKAPSPAPAEPEDEKPTPSPEPLPPSADERHKRLQSIKLVFEILGLAIAAIGGIIALIWRVK